MLDSFNHTFGFERCFNRSPFSVFNIRAVFEVGCYINREIFYSMPLGTRYQMSDKFLVLLAYHVPVAALDIPPLILLTMLCGFVGGAVCKFCC